MGSVRIELNIPGFNEFRNQAAVQAELHRQAQAIADRAGGAPDFVVIDEPNPTRARSLVVTATTEAMVEEATRRALTKALDAGRG